MNKFAKIKYIDIDAESQNSIILLRYISAIYLNHSNLQKHNIVI